MIIECPACKAKTNVPPGTAGKRFRCRKCNWVIQIPRLDAEGQSIGADRKLTRTRILLIVALIAVVGVGIALYFVMRNPSP